MSNCRADIASSGPASSRTFRLAKERLAIIVPVTLALIVGLLYCLFNSLLECLLTLSGIPFAVAGGVLALYVSGLNFSISAAIGFVSLFGVSVMNGILLITYYNQARLHGWTPVDAMLHAGTTRMRPLLMTSLSACIGLFPAAISTGIGSQVQRPLATVIVGGMLVGPIMLLIVVPALKIVFLGRSGEKSSAASSIRRIGPYEDKASSLSQSSASAHWRSGQVLPASRLLSRPSARRPEVIRRL